MFGELLWPATPEGHCVIGWLLLKTLMICWHIKVCFQLKNVPQRAKLQFYSTVLIHVPQHQFPFTYNKCKLDTLTVLLKFAIKCQCYYLQRLTMTWFLLLKKLQCVCVLNPL